MIERKFVAEKIREFEIKNYLSEQIGKGKYSYFEIKKTPLGDKITIYTSRPGLVVGKKGENIKILTETLKNKFKMENPQIEVAEVHNPDLEAQTMAEQIVNTFERFGPKRFKATGYRALQRIIDAGAIGAEIVIAGRGVPSSRSKTWRFYAGYLKKSGDVADSQILHGESVANIKSGSIGVKVKILPPDLKLPDKIEIKEPVKITASAEETEAAEEANKEKRKEDSKEEKKKEKVEKSKKEKKEKSKTNKEKKKENKTTSTETKKEEKKKIKKAKVPKEEKTTEEKPKDKTKK